MPKNENTTLTYNNEVYSLTITSRRDNISDLMDDLGEHDVISANEINTGKYDYLILMYDEAYDLTEEKLSKLWKGQSVTFDKVGNIEEIADKTISAHNDFLKWYFQN